MNKLIIAALVSAQLIGAQPALAAGFEGAEQTRLGVFGGVQLKLRLGGSRAEAPRASLGIAPVARSQGLDGAGRLRIGEGLQLSLTLNRPVELNLAGTRLDRLGLGPDGQAPDGPREGISMIGWVAIGVGVTAVVVVSAFSYCMSDTRCGANE